MRKTFPLTAAGHEPPRVVAAIKNEVRKYLRRERRKALPDGATHWAFRCQVGLGDAELEPKRVGEIIESIDLAAERNCAAITIEILAAPGVRAKKANGSEHVSEDEV
ncbi:MAG: DUF6172 family protein [Verrucomicrobiota bacterium]